MSVSYRNNTTGLLERAAGYSDTDAVLSPISRNPIQNKAVYDALAQKIEKTVADLENYYNTSQTYNKQEVRDLIGSINTLTIEVVATLPTEDISSTTIYFVGPKSGTTDEYDEYIYVNNAWVIIGNTTIDLSNYVTSDNLTTVLQSYYTKTQTDSLFDDYYDKDTTDDLLDTKQDVLTFDNLPTAGSPNVVTSTGIRTAINNAIVSSAGGSIIRVHHLEGSVVEGDIVTALKGDYSVSTTFDNDGDAIITGFGEIGERITITATNGTDVGIAYIDIPCFSNYSTTISYGVDYKTWLTTGGLNPSYYASLNEVLADEEAVRRLMTIHDSVDYLVDAICSVDDEDALAIFNNDYCAKWVSLRDYAMDTLVSNEYIVQIMNTIDKYGYGEWTLVPQVPIMTSNTAPYGTVLYGSENDSSYTGYKAFDGNGETKWLSASDNVSGMWIGYHFIEPTTINVIEYRQAAIAADGLVNTTATVQYSDDGTTWQDAETIQLQASDGYSLIRKSLSTPISTEYIRLKLASNNRYYSPSGVTAGKCGCFATLQFYTWQAKGNVPIMTSATVPYGQAIGSTESGSYYKWKVFNGTATDGNDIWAASANTGWIGYQFINPVCVKAFSFTPRNLPDGGRRTPKTFTLEGSNDLNTWNAIQSYSNTENEAAIPIFFKTTNDNYYLAYRINVTDTVTTASTTTLCLAKLQFYGRELVPIVPYMTGFTVPYGTVVSSSDYSDYYGWKAFATTGKWHSAAGVPQSLMYSYDSKILRAVSILSEDTLTFTIQGSNDDFTTIDYQSDEVTIVANKTNLINLQNNNSYSAYRVYITDTSYTSGGYKYARITQLQFYASDYSEKDFEIDTTKKWIYDHGVELETISGYSNGSGSYAVKQSNSLLGYRATVSSSYSEFDSPLVDLTDYSIARVRFGHHLINPSSQYFYIIKGSKTPPFGLVSSPDMWGYKAYGSDIPYTFGMDISSIDENSYISLRYAATASDIAIQHEFTEIWLE